MIGRGLLGRHLERELSARSASSTFRPQGSFSWGVPPVLRTELQRAAWDFSRHQRSVENPNVSFVVAWTAGVGVIGSPASILEGDIEAFRTLLDALEQAELPPRGILFFASTAGGAWGGSQDRPITEHSPDEPINEYGRARLRMETLTHAWIEAHPGWSGCIGRISTLFGVGQNLNKPQGFISHVSRSIIFGRPLNVFVSPHTLRDFLFAPDCAFAIAELLEHARQNAEGHERCITKILADERSVSLLQVIDGLERVSKRRVMVTLRPNNSSEQAPALVFKSRTAADGMRRRTDLITALNLLHQDQFRAFKEGRLVPPPL